MKTVKRFADAFRGIARAAVTQPNFRFHLLASVLVVAAGIYFKISSVEWLALSLAIGLVMAAEAINTSIEFLADALTKEEREDIRNVKDVAAGAVLTAVIVSLIVGGIIFLPKILMLF